jgi:hypothetical protein
MDKNRLRIKEQVEADIKKEMQPVATEEGEPGAEPVKEVKQPPPPKKVRKFPQFLIYFHVFDIATRKPVVEFEEYSESKVKGSAVKSELEGHKTRLLATKYEKDVLMPLFSIHEGYNWSYYVTKKNWVIFREIISVLFQEDQVLRNQHLLRCNYRFPQDSRRRRHARR